MCCVRRTDTEQLMCLELGNLSRARNVVADSFQPCYAHAVGRPQLMARECRPPDYILHSRGETVVKSLVVCFSTAEFLALFQSFYLVTVSHIFAFDTSGDLVFRAPESRI
jgi:hypothetical protein